MRISNRGLELIKQEEALRLKAYLCPGKVWTIGYGHTRGVREGMKISLSQAENMLRDDVLESEIAVNKHVKVSLSQNQFDALVSFVFNLGATKFKGSTLLKKLNIKDYKGAADEFLRWNRGGGIVLKGLQRRRAKERALFLER